MPERMCSDMRRKDAPLHQLPFPDLVNIPRRYSRIHELKQRGGDEVSTCRKERSYRQSSSWSPVVVKSNAPRVVGVAALLEVTTSTGAPNLRGGGNSLNHFEEAIEMN